MTRQLRGRSIPRVNVNTTTPIPRSKTEKLLRPWSQQARQLTPQRGTVAHLGNRGSCVHIHTGNLSTIDSPCECEHNYPDSLVAHLGNRDSCVHIHKYKETKPKHWRTRKRYSTQVTRLPHREACEAECVRSAPLGTPHCQTTSLVTS